MGNDSEELILQTACLLGFGTERSFSDKKLLALLFGAALGWLFGARGGKDREAEFKQAIRELGEARIENAGPDIAKVSIFLDDALVGDATQALEVYRLLQGFDNKTLTGLMTTLLDQPYTARQTTYADRRANPRGKLPDDTWVLRPQEDDRCFRPDGDTWYVGRRHVEDERSNPVVVDWRAPVSTPFYRATAADPMDLRRRRRFVMTGRTVDDLFDEVFDDPDSVDAAHHGGIPDPLLAELERVPDPERGAQFVSLIVLLHNLSRSVASMREALSSFCLYMPRDWVQHLVRVGKRPEIGGENGRLRCKFDGQRDLLGFGVGRRDGIIRTAQADRFAGVIELTGERAELALGAVGHRLAAFEQL